MLVVLIAIPYDGDQYDTVLGALLQYRMMEIDMIYSTLACSARRGGGAGFH